MGKPYIQLRCLEEKAACYNERFIYEELFDKKGDKRLLSKYINKFLSLNKEVLQFLGVEVTLSGIDHNICMTFRTSNVIGAVPLRMPYDGIVHKDLQVIPKFDCVYDNPRDIREYHNDNLIYENLVQILSLLSYSIKPEYVEKKLFSRDQLRPPAYYEAVKYIELFGVVVGYLWTKFRVLDRNYEYPKAGTNWCKYALTSINPQRALMFPTKDNILSTNHVEWQNLKYVFDIAQNIVMEQSVPASIKYKYREKIRHIVKAVEDIQALEIRKLGIHVNDPSCVKKCKEQANILLQRNATVSLAWRMDMAELFERFVQHVVQKSIKGLSGIIVPNHKIHGYGNIPNWGLKYLEPDVMVRFGQFLLMADAKYKSNMYALYERSNELKETHRADLHQLLAYCSFEPQKNKLGLLLYPCYKFETRQYSYCESFGGMKNKVILCGVPFTHEINIVNESVEMIKTIIQQELLKS